jgi:hypothetical protein
MCPLSPGASPFTFPHTTILSGALIAPAIENRAGKQLRLHEAPAFPYRLEL